MSDYYSNYQKNRHGRNLILGLIILGIMFLVWLADKIFSFGWFENM